MDETRRPGHHFAPGLFEDYCQIFNWQLISASIEAVSKSLVLKIAGDDWLATQVYRAAAKSSGYDLPN